MSEQIKTTTVDQLPEADKLDGLYVFGYDATKPAGKRSVKAPITLLKGNKGETGAAGKDGKDGKDGEVTAARLAEALRGAEFLATEEINGLMTKEQVKQLKELIENMKTDADKYKTLVAIKFGAEISPATRDMIKAKGNNIEYYIKAQSYEYKNVADKEISLNPIISASEVTQFRANNLQEIEITASKNGELSLVCASSEATLKKVSLYGAYQEVDLSSVPYLENLVLADTNIQFLNLKSSKQLVNLGIPRNKLLKTVYAEAKKIDRINITGCDVFEKIVSETNFEVLRVIEAVSSGLKRLALMEIESKWTSRIGLNSGVLTLSKALYEELSEEEKLKFINKNITIQFV